MLVERVRSWLGAKIVQIGIKVAGFDLGKLAEPPRPEEQEDELDDEPVGDATYAAVELNDRAREMVLEGMTAPSPTRRIPSKSKVLTGSVQARIQQERDRARAYRR